MFFFNRLLRLINHIFNAWADYGFGLGDAKFFYEFPYNFYRILSEINIVSIWLPNVSLHFFELFGSSTATGPPVS